MPRRKARKGDSSVSAASGQITRCPFRVVASITLTAATVVTEYNLIPTNLGDRVGAISDNFNYWRLRSLVLSVYSDYASNAGAAAQYAVHGFAMSPAIYATAPTTLEDIVDYPVFAANNILFKEKVRVPKSVLNTNPLKWFKTRDVGDDSLFSMGEIFHYYASGVALGTSYFLWEGEVEFKGMVDPEMNPLIPRPYRHPVPGIVRLKPEEEKTEADVEMAGPVIIAAPAEIIIPPGGLNANNTAPTARPQLRPTPGWFTR